MGEHDGSKTTRFVTPAADALEGPVNLAEAWTSGARIATASAL